jgi:hypothetical protein
MRTFVRTLAWTPARCCRLAAIAMIAATALSACGGGGGSSMDGSSPPPANAAPVITGTAPSVATVGSLYSFTPSASDADGDQLTFGITGKPTWADFDSTNGKLSGVPTANASGSVSDVRISVSDGKASSDLAFSVRVESGSSGAGTATLTWSKPTQNEDGSPLTDLAGYRIYYGTSSNLDRQLEIGNGSITTTSIEGLAAGTWYFAMTSVNSSGEESERTQRVSVIL